MDPKHLNSKHKCVGISGLLAGLGSLQECKGERLLTSPETLGKCLIIRRASLKRVDVNVLCVTGCSLVVGGI